MRVKLYEGSDESRETIENYLMNRGMNAKDIGHYLCATIDNAVAPPEGLGEDLLREGISLILNTIASKGRILVTVDCDVDGYTSAAMLMNYLYDVLPSYTKEYVDFVHHAGKQHGLNDVMDTALLYDLVICPDAGTNDAEEHKILAENGIKVLCLDHHEQDVMSTNAIIINNQIAENYENKYLSGAGVVWQFCRYWDKLAKTDYASKYLDLLAVGLQSDMMSMQNPETKALIFAGLTDTQIRNPFLMEMIAKNQYSFTKADYVPGKFNDLVVTPTGVSFFISPLLNALSRSGTMEEKDIIFKAMLKYRAYEEIPSTKRGCKGQFETIVTQAVRTAANVKARQERNATAGMEILEKMVEEKELLNHKVLLFLLKPGQIEPGLAGLVANKCMAKYQRCCMVLTEGYEEEVWGPSDDIEAVPVYRGSMRAYSASGLNNFKQVCEDSRGCRWIHGHASAAGCCLNAKDIDKFLEDTDKALKDLPDEPSYYVDYIWNMDTIDGERILELCDCNDYIGQDLPRTQVYIKNVKITNSNYQVMKDIHLKIKCGEADIIIWSIGDKINDLIGKTINVVCKVNCNEWQGRISPQLIAIEYEIAEEEEKSPVIDWGF